MTSPRRAGQPLGVAPTHRRSIRLAGYDYRHNGAYFITVVTQERLCLFGDIAGVTMQLSAAGQMVQDVWDELPHHYPGVSVDVFVVMPNHTHGILVLGAQPSDGATTGGCPYKPLSLADVVHRYKTMTTKRYTDGVKQGGWPRFDRRLWQRNYYEHIIRDENSLRDIRRYIADNPMRWQEDTEHPYAGIPQP